MIFPMNSFFFTLSSLFFFLFSLWTHVSSAADTISGEFTLSGDQTIVSANGTFEMGFIFLQPDTASKFYIGMWYKKLPDQTIVWVANREKPVTDKTSSVLKISNGNLVLLDGQNQTPVWSTGLNSTSSSALEAVLHDDGNLVLRDELGSVLWQSFDHPGNTWLPGVKIRFDKRTNKSQRLTSWKNLGDPSPGLFSLELDDSTAYKILWNGSNEYWSSGPWNPQRKIFELVPEMRLNYIYNYDFVSNSTESYFTYTLYNPANVSRLVMEVSGQIKQYTWLESNKAWNLFWAQPRIHCEIYPYCGSFGVCNDKFRPVCQCLQGFRPVSRKDWDLNEYSAGCVRRTELECREGEASRGDINQFLSLSNMKLPEKPEVLERTSFSGCGSACLRSCSCEAYAHNESFNNCFMWSRDVLKLQQLEKNNSEGKTFYLRLAASEIHNGSSDAGLSTGAKAGIASASGFVVVLILIAGSLNCVIRFPRKTSDNLRQRNLKALIPLKHYSYAQVKKITKSFAQVVGKGGFGTVYRGNLCDGRSVAVKILKDSMGNGEDFMNEVASMSKTSHVNIVSLLGFCSEGSKRAIIYEYLENGSLDQFISSKTSVNMDWKALYGIALGVARGLEYLHHGCKTRIVHFDIKPQNVLLDENLCPKVSDFGLAKLCEKKESILSLLDMRGTIGYIAPEVFSRMYGRVSHKSDVYSYGMLVLEMIGARNKERADENTSSMYFPDWIFKDLEKVESGRLIENGINSEEEEMAKKMTIVGLWCIQSSPTDRPPMNRVVEMMEGDLNALEVPPRPVLQQIPSVLLQESSTLSENDSRFTETYVSLNVV